jgi:F0F1-type ATP synthase delta subunit
MLESTYAQAIAELLAAPKADAKAVAEGLKLTLARRGHMALLPRIMAHLDRAKEREAGKRATRVRLAAAADKKAALAKAAEMTGASPDDIEVIEDASLIAGFAVEGPGVRYDASSRAALMDLYRTLAK